MPLSTPINIKIPLIINKDLIKLFDNLLKKYNNNKALNNIRELLYSIKIKNYYLSKFLFFFSILSILTFY